MIDGHLPRQEQENTTGKLDKSISSFLGFIVSPFVTTLMSVWDGGGSSFDRNGFSKGTYPTTITPAPVATYSPPAPAPKPEPVRKPVAADPARCGDCIYSSGRCFRMLKFWVRISGKQCQQSHRKRLNYTLLPEGE